MIDDDTMSSLLARAGESFSVPATGAPDVMARALGDPSAADQSSASDQAAGDGQSGRTPSRVGRVVRLAGRHRVLTAAACVVLALLGAGTVGALTGGTSRPSVTAGPVRTAAPVTTVPSPQRSLHAGTAPSAGLPYGSVKQPSSVGASGAPSTTPTSPSLPSGAVDQNARIEQTGTLAVSVGQGRLGASMDRLEVLAGANGGFVASSQTQSGRGAGGSPYGSVTLEVPVGSFQATLKAAESAGPTTNVSTKATDVTGQYVDLQARIASLEASRQQYLTIMSKATTVGDVLAVQAQLDSIQSQIEQLQGQLQVLTGRDLVLHLVGDHRRGHTAGTARPAPPVGTGARLARQRRRLRGRGRRRGPRGRPGALRPPVPHRRARRWTHTVAALPAPPALRSDQRPAMGATSGMPGMVTTPMPPDGPTSSLTAIGPLARTKI